jgi:hypothetical protein
MPAALLVALPGAEPGVILAASIALLIIAWVVRLVRRGMLYVGYGVIFVIACGLGIAAVTFPAVLEPLHVLSDLFTRSIPIVVLVLLFMLLILIYILSQLTLLSDRVTSLTQQLAIREAHSSGEDARSD